jgi:cytochrome P450
MSISTQTITVGKLLLNLPFLLKNPEKLLTKWSLKSDITIVPYLSSSFYLINNPLIARDLLIKYEENLSKGTFFEIARESIGNGTLLADEPDHEIRLNAIKNVFRSKEIEEYAPDFNNLSTQSIQNVIDNESVDIRKITQDFTLQAAMLTLFKSKAETSTSSFQNDFNSETEYLTATRLLTRVIEEIELSENKSRRPYEITLKFVIRLTIHLFSYRLRRRGESIHSANMRNFAKDLINAPTLVNKGEMDLLFHLKQAQVDNKDFWNEDAQVDEILTFLLAGHETTANTLAWVIIEATKAGMTPIPIQSIDQIIFETLRLHPPAWVLPRQVSKTIMIDGYEIPTDANILISPYIYHRIDSYFPDPLRFDPSRWDNVQFKDAPAAYLPFGAGGRGCIGQRFALAEMREFLTKFATTGPWKLSGSVPKEEFLLTLRPEGCPTLIKR